MTPNKNPCRLVLIQGKMIALYHDRVQVAVWEADWTDTDAPALIEQVRTMKVQ